MKFYLFDIDANPVHPGDEPLAHRTVVIATRGLMGEPRPVFVVAAVSADMADRATKEFARLAAKMLERVTDKAAEEAMKEESKPQNPEPSADFPPGARPN